MTTADISKAIDVAIRSEGETGGLRQRLTRQLDQLQEQLLLPEEEPVAALMDFITRYVESVPDSLLLVTEVSQALGYYNYAAPFLYLAEDFFLAPPDTIDDDSALGSLLDEAFLAHRLLEEVNDHHVRHLQQPLLPVDMTEANIIVHHLIGDALASKLEKLVQYAASELLARGRAWEHAGSLWTPLPVSVQPVVGSDIWPQSQVQVHLRLRH